MELYFYEEKYKKAVEGYKLSEIQLRYTELPIECMKESKSDPDRHPVLAIEDEQFVTFLDLHNNKGVSRYSHNQNAILIRTFSTDFRFQRKGYAQKTLELLPNFIQKYFPEIDEMVLAVNIMNKVAQGLYKKCGFVDKGVRKMEKKGELIIMSYDLK